MTNNHIAAHQAAETPVARETKGKAMTRADCPRCKGQGFYLSHAGRGYYRDGSFGHNEWQDCSCDVVLDEEGEA